MPPAASLEYGMVEHLRQQQQPVFWPIWVTGSATRAHLMASCGFPTIQVEYQPIVHLPSCSRKAGGLSCLCSLLPQSGKLVHLGYNGLLSHQYVVQERLWGVGLQHGFLLALTATFWKPVVHYNKGKLNIFNWVYWRSIGLSLTSVGLLGSMSPLNILPSTSRPWCTSRKRVFHQSVHCMVASMDWLHVGFYKRSSSIFCLYWITCPLPPYQCCYCFSIIYHHLSLQVRWYPGRGCVGRLGQQHEPISWLHVASPLYKWNINP